MPAEKLRLSNLPAFGCYIQLAQKSPCCSLAGDIGATVNASVLLEKNVVSSTKHQQRWKVDDRNLKDRISERDVNKRPAGA